MIQVIVFILGIAIVGYAGLRLSCMIVEWYDRKLAEGFQRVANAIPMESEKQEDM